MNRKVHVGQIWKVVTDDFLTSGDKSTYKRPVKLAKGEFIEIRYPYEWHFRTQDAHYLHARTPVILENCEYVGDVLEQVWKGNKASLEEIIRLKLYFWNYES